jgi:transcriptional regulator with XRE-family HTH domain
VSRTSTKPGQWSRAVRELLKAARISVARVAEASGLEGPTLFRYLGAQRQPTTETVRVINEVVGYLLHDEQRRIARYLDSCYGLDHATDVEYVHDDVLEAFGLTTSASLPYLRAEAPAQIDEVLRAMPRKKLWHLQAAVNAMFRRRLMPYIAGDREPSKSWFEDLCDVFRKHDVDLRRWLKPKNELDQRLQEDLFEKRVRNALRAIADPADRAAAESTILDAFRDVMGSWNLQALRMLSGKTK